MDMKETILAEMEKIEKRCGVRILYAAEAGSRAWGFPSPDSDYDVRFVYVRPAYDYLRLDEVRDVIEWKLDEVLDINGWDLRKTLKQFARGNAALFEWCLSPVVYRSTGEWEQVRKVADPCFSGRTAVHHYCGIAYKTWAEHLQGETVRYKKYLYALRPLLAAQYIEANGCPPPVLFSELLKMEIGPELRSAVEDLLEKKKTATEEDFLPQIPAVRDFIQEELQRRKGAGSGTPDDRNPDWAALNRCFAGIIRLKTTD